MISESSIRASRIALPVRISSLTCDRLWLLVTPRSASAAFGLLARAYPNEVPDELKNEIDVCTKLMDDIGSEHACSGFLDR
jgi:hypothetical protein